MTNDSTDKSDPGKAIKMTKTGQSLLHDPRYNKGTGFSRAEREMFDLEGLLPNSVTPMDKQLERVHIGIRRKSDPLEKYIGLVGLQDRNETLFYRLLVDNVEEFLPIVYTPTVGLATQQYSHIFRRARGIWITPDHRGRVRQVLENSGKTDVRLIVVTDGERILGLGDQGAGGMAIPIGKLALYTVGAGIHPSHTLPVCLDVGTDNEELLQDDLYIGRRERRMRGDEYDSLVDEFVTAVKELYPEALLQWEDFKKVNAMLVLERYREELLSFNDDIQGTAAVTVAGVLAGVRATEMPLVDHKFVILGAGAAGIGIAKQIRSALEQSGLPKREIAAKILVLDSQGLLVEGRTYRQGEGYKEDFSLSLAEAGKIGLEGFEGHDLEAVVRAFQPTVLIGTSGQPGVFTEEIIRTMAEAVERPIIFPFSNPTSKSEAQPVDLIEWTEGRGVVATGSPFEPVEFEGRTHRIGQGNNVFIFPGVGLGALVSRSTRVSDLMFTVAAETLADQVTDEELESGLLYPELSRLREVSATVALAVAEEAARSGISPPATREELSARIQESMWDPVYPTLTVA